MICNTSGHIREHRDHREAPEVLPFSVYSVFSVAESGFIWKIFYEIHFAQYFGRCPARYAGARTRQGRNSGFHAASSVTQAPRNIDSSRPTPGSPRSAPARASRAATLSATAPPGGFPRAPSPAAWPRRRTDGSDRVPCARELLRQSVRRRQLSFGALKARSTLAAKK